MLDDPQLVKERGCHTGRESQLLLADRESALGDHRPDHGARYGDLMKNIDGYGAELLALVVENSELRLQLAQVQDQCVELAVDSGELHAEIEALRKELAELRAGRSSAQ